MNKSAQNMQIIYEAKKTHDANCPFGGVGVRILMSHFDIERLGWEEGDVVAGLVVTADESRQAGVAWVECDAEPKPDEELIEKLDLKSEDLVTA